MLVMARLRGDNAALTIRHVREDGKLNLQLQGRVALITAGGRGIGGAVAIALARHGVR